jgi:hypothetical protein
MGSTDQERRKQSGACPAAGVLRGNEVRNELGINYNDMGGDSKKSIEQTECVLNKYYEGPNVSRVKNFVLRIPSFLN